MARPNIRTRFLSATVALSLAACASQSSPDDPVRAALLEHACNDVMGLELGEVTYLRCVESLRASLDSLNAANSAWTETAPVLRARRLADTCTAAGFELNSAASSTCIVSLDAAVSVRMDN